MTRRQILPVSMPVPMLACAALLLCFACESPEKDTTTDDPGLTAVPAGGAPGPPGQSGHEGFVSPENERSRARREAFDAAVAGLSFQTPRGVVEVSPLGAADAVAAKRHREHGDRLMAINHHTEAIGAYAKAVRTDPADAGTWVALGLALLHERKSEMAIASFRTAVDRDPASADARYQLGAALAMADRKPEAIETLELLVRLEPGHGKAHERLAVWHYYGADYERARLHADAATAAGHTMPPQFMLLLEEKLKAES